MPAGPPLSAEKLNTPQQRHFVSQLNGLVEQCMATGESCFEDSKFLGCNSLEDPDHLFILQHYLGDPDHLLIGCCDECIDKA